MMRPWSPCRGAVPRHGLVSVTAPDRPRNGADSDRGLARFEAAIRRNFLDTSRPLRCVCAGRDPASFTQTP